MSQFMLIMSQLFSKYTRTRVPSFYEQIWQLENNHELTGVNPSGVGGDINCIVPPKLSVDTGHVGHVLL